MLRRVRPWVFVSARTSSLIRIKLAEQLCKGLVHALAGGFSTGEFRRLVRFSIGERLEEIVADGMPLPESVTGVVDAPERRGTLNVPPRGVLKSRPRPVPVGQFCLEHFPGLTARPEVAGLIAASSPRSRP
jgi:hypothetical protein